MVYKITRSFLALIALALYLSACTTVTSPTPTLPTRPPATAKVVPTMIFTPLPEPTFTPNVPVPTYTLASTPTFPPELMQYRCLDVTQGFPPGNNTNGTIYVGVGPGPGPQPSDVYKIDLEAKSLLTSSEYDEYASSPNGLWLAIYHAITDQTGLIVDAEIRIESSDGERIATYSWESNWKGFHWLDNNQLIIYYKPDIYYLFSVKVVNPFTGEQHELIPDYPDVNRVANPNHPFYPIPNPSLTRVAYPLANTRESAWVLWDLTSGQALASLSEGISFVEVPAWSPDGRQFVVDLYTGGMLVNEFYSVSWDGQQITQLTHFGNYTLEGMSVRIQTFSWSPDGRYIAFWVAVDPSPYSGERLAILDKTTLEVTNYCVHGSDWVFEGGAMSPIWSPNSQQLVVESYDAEGYVHTVLVDIIHDFAYNIADSVRPSAWTIDQP